MSTQDRTTPTDRFARRVPRPTAVAHTARTHLLASLRRLGFWLAIVLPFLAVPLLVTGLSTRSEQVALGVLLVCNVVALVLGRGHEP